MAKVELRRKGAPAVHVDVDRVPVAGDYIVAGGLGRVVAVVLTPGADQAAVAFAVKDSDNVPDEVQNAFG